MDAGAPCSICLARVEDEANEDTTSTPNCFLNAAAISLIALVVDAAAKIVTCPVSAAKQLVTETRATPITIELTKWGLENVLFSS